MTWVRVDDQFQDHPKFLDVSLAGVGLWVAGLAYCSRYLTDGFIADAAAKRLGATRKLLDELKAAGLWRPVDGGWLIHDYHDYHPSSDKVRDERARKAAAGRRGGLARAAGVSANGQAESKQSAKQIASSELSKIQARGPRSRPDPLLSNSCVTTSPPPNGDEEEEESSKVIETALTILAERRLAARSPTLEPIVDLQKWLAVTTCNLLAEHRKRIKGLVLEGLDGPAIADAIDPPATLSPVVELAPRCPRCPTRHHPAEPHSVADGDLLPEPGSVP